MFLTETTLLHELEKTGFPPLKIESTSIINLNTKFDGKYSPDVILKLVWQEQSNSFITELVPIATPQNIFIAEQKLKQLGQNIKNSANDKETYYPLIVANYLKSSDLDKLVNNGISAIDLCGNGVIQVPGKWFIHRSGAKNLFPTTNPIKNVFAGNSSLVARVFFSQDSFNSVNQVLKEIVLRQGNVTLSTVSKVLKTLQEQLLITKNKEINLLDAGKLLSELSTNYQKPSVKRILIGKTSDINNVLSQLASNSKTHNIELVGFDPNLYAVMPSQNFTKIYTSNLDKLLIDVNITETNRFPNIEIRETSDPIIYFDKRYKDGFYWTPPLQTYLELNSGDKREQDTAKQIATDLINLKYVGRK